MTPTNFALFEPIRNAAIKTLETRLPAAIEQINEAVTDNIQIDKPAQYLKAMPFLGTLSGGLPLVAVQWLGGEFEDDLQSSADATHTWAVIPVIQQADNTTLAVQLERTVQAIANALQVDRTQIPAGTSIMRTEAGVWSVNFLRVEPGPLLGDLDPLNPGSVPASYMSWLGFVVSSKRREA